MILVRNHSGQASGEALLAVVSQRDPVRTIEVHADMSAKRTTERAAVRVARKLVSEIRRRRLRPGTKLASEHTMVEKMGVARATVREALRFLELQGALRIKAGPGGGPVVSVPAVDRS